MTFLCCQHSVLVSRCIKPTSDHLTANKPQNNHMNQPHFFESRIKEDVVFGENVKVVKPVNMYGCVVGEQCFIGPFVEIQKDVTIGSRTKIQSHSFICELVTIGSDCFIGHGVMFINDLFSKCKNNSAKIIKAFNLSLRRKIVFEMLA